MLTSLDHVVIAVRDLDQAEDRYVRLLGRRPSWRGSHPELGTANALFRLENTYIELLAPVADRELARVLRERIDRQGEGLLALALGSDDAVRSAGKLREHGLAAPDPTPGEGHERATGARRRWRSLHLPESETRGVHLFVIEHLSESDALPAAEPTGALEGCVAALDHVVIRSRHAEATRALYQERLGLRLALDRSFEARELRLLFFRIGGVTVEIASSLRDEPEAETPDRLWGLAYRVPDVAAIRERASAAGLEVSKVRPGHKPGTRVCTVEGETHGVATLLIGPE